MAAAASLNPHGRPQGRFTHNYTPGARSFNNRFQPTPRIVDTPTGNPTVTSATRVGTTSAPRPAVPTVGTTPAGSSSKSFVPNCWKCGGPHWPRQCETAAKPSSAVTRQLFDKVDELDSHMETVRKLFAEVEELPEDADEDRGLMEKLMEEHPLFFTPTDG